MPSYDENCDLTFEQIWVQMDHYFVIHWVDYLLASFVLRDFWLCHLWSILVEIMELSWQHIFPHFRECWWDHVLIDVTLANTPAIFVGLFLVRKLGIEEYDWLGSKGKKSVWDWGIWRW